MQEQYENVSWRNWLAVGVLGVGSFAIVTTELAPIGILSSIANDLGENEAKIGLIVTGYANVRQPPISTLNLAHMIPLSAVWAGPERNEHLGAPPLLYGKTEGSTPFRLSLHVGDVGHTLVVGPTGAGKSVLLALMALQFRRYERSQIFAFDFGGSIRASALAMGGDWHDLGGGLTEGSEVSVSLQPLARIDDAYERSWAADWIAAILMREGITITPEVKEHIWTGLTSLASAPVSERTITGLAVLLQSNDLKQALRPYCIGGAYGRLLDAETEQLGSADVQAFEIEGLVGTGAAPAVLAYQPVPTWSEMTRLVDVSVASRANYFPYPAKAWCQSKVFRLHQNVRVIVWTMSEVDRNTEYYLFARQFVSERNGRFARSLFFVASVLATGLYSSDKVVWMDQGSPQLGQSLIKQFVAHGMVSGIAEARPYMTC